MALPAGARSDREMVPVDRPLWDELRDYPLHALILGKFSFAFPLENTQTSLSQRFLLPLLFSSTRGTTSHSFVSSYQSSLLQGFVQSQPDHHQITSDFATTFNIFL